MKLLLFILFVFFNNINANHVILNTTNHVILKGPIDSTTSSKLVHQILKNTQKNLYIHISSPGGSVISGNEIIDAIISQKEMGTNIYCIGDVAISMAFVIFQECPVRYIQKSSILMQHQMSFGTEGPIENVKSYVEFINSIKDQAENRQAKRLQISNVLFERKILTDWWLFGENILKNKAADEIITVSCIKELLQSDYTETHLTLFGNIKIKYSNCPLIRNPLEISFDNIKNIDNMRDIIDNYYIDRIIRKYNKKN